VPAAARTGRRQRIADWTRDPLIPFSLLPYQSGPFMGVTIAPDPATVTASGTLTVTATVSRSPVQMVNWSIESGGGSITPDGVYTITATSSANGLKPETRATVDVEVTAKEPDPDPDPRSSAGKGRRRPGRSCAAAM
jgi:hypothetical protein